MERALHNLLSKYHFPKNEMAFITGPRQVGKTFLAKKLLKERGCSDLYRNWDDLEWRRELVRTPYGFVDNYHPKSGKGKPLVVLDEIHKYPRWKKYLKGFWDTRGENIDLIVTGSGRLDVYQRDGDSLLGRYRQHLLHPLSMKETLNPEIDFGEFSATHAIENLISIETPATKKERDTFENLLKWGGFPKPFMAKNENDLRLWHRERKRLLVKEDLRDLSRIQLVSHVEELVELLAERAGQVLSYNSLREDMQVAFESVRLWIGYLIRLYYIYTIRPFSGKIARAIRREPKLYLWDWSEIRNEGARFENLIASHLLKWCSFTKDWGFEPLELHFVRDKEKREVDFLLTKDKKPWMLIEAKLSEREPGGAIHYFADVLGVKHKFLIVAEPILPGMAKDVNVLSAASFLSALPV